MRDPEVSVSDLRVDAARLLRPTDEELRRWASNRRVFISGVMDLAAARSSAIDGVEATGAEAVAWERITPRPVAPEDAWLDGVATSDSFVLLLGMAYGRRRPDGFSATHKEFLRAEELGLERWIFTDARVNSADRDGYLQTWMGELTERYSYGTYPDEGSLRTAVARVIANLARYRLYTWHKVGSLVIRADEVRLTPPAGGFGSDHGSLDTEGRISDPAIRTELAEIHARRRPVPLVVDGQLFEATLMELEERAARGESGYRAHYRLDAARLNDAMLWMTLSESGGRWEPADLVDLTIREVIGLPTGPRPSMLRARAAVDWSELVAKAGRIPELVQVLAELVVGGALLESGAVTRIGRVEARLVGPPPRIAVRVAGVYGPGQGLPSRAVSVAGDVPI